MNIAILTSSRADYGACKPLIKALNDDPFFHLDIIAFGSHLSTYHGHTVDEIVKDGYSVDYKINSILLTDDENSISSSIGLTVIKFAEFWNAYSTCFDWVFCVGDRFEMFAAVIAGLPYGIQFAHVHGGEITLGAIDNVFRHSISLASKLHFVATETFANKIKSIIDGEENDNIVISGALVLDNIVQIKLLSKKEFLKKWQIDLAIPSILITIHPETVTPSHNSLHLKEMVKVLIELQNRYQLIITMPNTDTYGSVYRVAFKKLKEKYHNKIKIIENFGTQSYFTCMKEVKFMLGNTSSGIIEAASFHTYVINVGDRQKGRLSGENVLHAPFSKTEIMRCVSQIETAKHQQRENIYYNGGAVEKIIKKLKSLSD